MNPQHRQHLNVPHFPSPQRVSPTNVMPMRTDANTPTNQTTVVSDLRQGFGTTINSIRQESRGQPFPGYMMNQFDYRNPLMRPVSGQPYGMSGQTQRPTSPYNSHTAPLQRLQRPEARPLSLIGSDLLSVYGPGSQQRALERSIASPIPRPFPFQSLAQERQPYFIPSAHTPQMRADQQQRHPSVPTFLSSPVDSHKKVVIEPNQSSAIKDKLMQTSMTMTNVNSMPNPHIRPMMAGPQRDERHFNTMIRGHYERVSPSIVLYYFGVN